MKIPSSISKTFYWSFEIYYSSNSSSSSSNFFVINSCILGFETVEVKSAFLFPSCVIIFFSRGLSLTVTLSDEDFEWRFE
jgi:hypothetical protein